VVFVAAIAYIRRRLAPARIPAGAA
jgi:hypothetical protein